jgi:RimJ/RimL family protein N-acetyltransferase
MGPSNGTGQAVLRDGTTVQIRPVTPGDKDRLIELFYRLSPRSVYFRYFRTKQRLTEADLSELTDVDFDRSGALAATLVENSEERIVGVIRYRVTAESPSGRCAEVNFTVADQHQGRGIGKLLLRHLVPLARSRGIVEFEAYVLPENKRMLSVFARSGFEVKQEMESDVVHITFPIKTNATENDTENTE